jgi:heparin binding hemagglutinin HbhA
MTTTKTRKIPAPLYAVAGVGDLAYQQLRRLPEQVNQLRAKAAEIRPQVADAVSDTNFRADLDRLRSAARRNAQTVVAGAQQAGERATAVYTQLVARGQQVVANVRPAEALVEVSPAAGTITTITEAPSVEAADATPVKKVAKKTTAPKKTV